jgi:hypothetical protein
MKKIFGLAASVLTLAPRAVMAACPVCTAAILVGLEGARRAGLDYSIVGVWAGGAFTAVVFWIWTMMKKHGVKNPFWYLLPPIGPLSLAVTMWMSRFVFGSSTLFGIDSFLLGIVSGVTVFVAAIKWHLLIKRRNGGKSWFPMQKVVWPVSALAIVSLVLAAIVYL